MIGNRYVLRTAIGHGGMGTVWRASDTLLRRDVAVKEVLLPPGMAPSDRDAMYQRTLREARAAAGLSHPAVVQVYDVVTEDGRPWIVMELLQARSLSEMIVEDGPLAPRAVGKIGVALLGALEVAHAASVLHRDVKPANVLICSDGRCVLTDFGVARMPTDSELTTPGMVLGSPHFISPERAIGAPFGPPSDLFSLGVTLYTAVEGRPPFDKRDPFETMRAVVEEPPAPAVRAGALAGVLYGLLEKDPARRWKIADARHVLRDLLAGPLASNAPAHVTDPYAVVRPTWNTPATDGSRPATSRPDGTGQVGGRAMLAPGESVTGAIRRLRPDSAPTDPTLTTLPPATAPTPPGAHAAPAAGAPARVRAAALTALTSVRAAAAPAAGRARAFVGRVPQWMQIATVAGLIGVLLIGLSAASGLMGGDPPDQPTPKAQASSAPAGPPIEAQPYVDARGMRINVPKTWSNVPAGSYVDFIDPEDRGRKLRVNVERSGPDPRGFLRIAEENLKKNTASCTAPYTAVSLRDVELAGRQAAELEYTCGSGDTQRHGIWRAVVHNGKAYHFFLTVPSARFEESRRIYDEMVKSFQLTA